MDHNLCNGCYKFGHRLSFPEALVIKGNLRLFIYSLSAMKLDIIFKL